MPGEGLEVATPIEHSTNKVTEGVVMPEKGVSGQGPFIEDNKCIKTRFGALDVDIDPKMLIADIAGGVKSLSPTAQQEALEKIGKTVFFLGKRDIITVLKEEFQNAAKQLSLSYSEQQKLDKEVSAILLERFRSAIMGGNLLGSYMEYEINLGERKLTLPPLMYLNLITIAPNANSFSELNRKVAEVYTHERSHFYDFLPSRIKELDSQEALRRFKIGAKTGAIIGGAAALIVSSGDVLSRRREALPRSSRRQFLKKLWNLGKVGAAAWFISAPLAGGLRVLLDEDLDDQRLAADENRADSAIITATPEELQKTAQLFKISSTA
jgi:hypothetical protein